MPGSPLQTALAERLNKLLDETPELRDTAVEIGLIDRQWLEAPGQHAISTATPLEVLRRFVERSVERRPSTLGRLGLKGIDALSWDVSWNRSPHGAADRTADVTVVFTDLEGFTRFTATEGDAAALSLLDQYNKAIMPIVRGWGGRVVKRLGDGLMLAFTGPVAAVHAAVAVTALRPGPLRLRAGAHTGEAVVTADDVLGNVVNVAARVTDQAEAGQVLISGELRASIGDPDGLQITGPTDYALKGFDAPVPLYVVERA